MLGSVLEMMDPCVSKGTPETVRSLAPMSDARMPMVYGSWQRVSRQNFVLVSLEKELCSGLKMKYKGWE
jgi:hypothetical protein